MLKSSSVNVIHLLLIGPYLTYVGLNGRKCGQMCFNILAGVGVLVMVYHAYRLYQNMNGNVTIHSVGSAVTNTISNVSGQLIGQDNNNNNVVIDESGNVAVVDESGNVVNMNNEAANESANQAMHNNAVMGNNA